MWDGDAYCSECGQKKYTGPPSFWQLFTDFFEVVFNLDNKLFRTLATMLVPGRLTRSYLAGKQRPYLNPLRAFFVAAVIMIATFTILLSSVARTDLNNQQKKNHKRGHQQIFNEHFILGLDSTRLVYPDFGPEEAVNYLRKRVLVRPNDSTNYGYFRYLGGLSFQEVSVKVSMRDFVEMPPEEIADKYKVEGDLNRYQFIQILRIQDADSRGILVMFGQLIWGLVLLVPLCALPMKLIYLRRKRRYIEHFIFSLHTHTVMFLLLTMATLFHYFFDFSLAYAVVGILVVIYFLWALKAVYKQSWFKTLAKGGLLFIFYCFFLVLCTAVAGIFSVLTF